MTTANIGQAANETIATNPAAPAAAAQVINEAVAANPGLAVWIGQTITEVVWGISNTVSVLTWNGKRVDGTHVG